MRRTEGHNASGTELRHPEPGVEEARDKTKISSPLDAGSISPRGIKEVVVEYDEGAEVLTPRLNERFGAYDLHEAANYVFFVSNHITEGRY